MVKLFLLLTLLTSDLANAGSGSDPYLSSINTTKVALAEGATYTGTWEKAFLHSTVVVGMLTDAPGTLKMQFSSDASSLDSSLSYTVDANVREVHRLEVTSAYYRVVFIDDTDGVTQTFMRITSAFGHQNLLSAPSNLSVQLDADAIVSRSIPGELDIARGKFSGFQMVHKFGRNLDTSAGEDVWALGGVYTGFPLTTLEKVEVVSSDAADTNTTGAGAWSVYIEGLDASYNFQSETVLLSGTTPVDSVNTYRRLSRAYVVTSATNNTVFNAGTITIRHTTTTANVFAAIPIGLSQTQVGCYSVPTGKKAYIKYLEIMPGKNQTANLQAGFWIRLSGASPRIINTVSASSVEEHKQQVYGGIELPANTDVCVRVFEVSTTNVRVYVLFDLVLIDDI